MEQDTCQRNTIQTSWQAEGNLGRSKVWSGGWIRGPGSGHRWTQGVREMGNHTCRVRACLCPESLLRQGSQGREQDCAVWAGQVSLCLGVPAKVLLSCTVLASQACVSCNRISSIYQISALNLCRQRFTKLPICGNWCGHWSKFSQWQHCWIPTNIIKADNAINS